MSAPSSVSSKRKRIAASTILVSLFCACAAFGPAQGQSPSSRQDASIPNFSPSSTVGWLKAGVGDEFLSPDTGPGPVVSDPAHGYSGNFLLTTGNAKPFKIADLTNPIHEMVCAENNEDHFNQGLVPIPQADKVEF